MKKFKAMTLVELVVYLALFGVIFLTIMQFVITTNQNNDTARGRNIIENNSIFLLRHIENSFKSIQSIDEVNSVFDSDQGRLVLNTSSGIVEYLYLDNNLEYIKDGISYNMLLPGFKINKFNLVKILSNDDQLLGVIVTIDMDSLNYRNVSKNISTSFLIK